MMYTDKRPVYTGRQTINDKRGFGTLLTALFVSALGALVVAPVILLGLAGQDTGRTSENGAAARMLAHACAERALEEIRQQTNFSGSDTITAYTTGECSYTVSNQGAQNRRIEAAGTAGEYTRRTVVEIDNINPEINIVEWEEVSGF